MNGFFPAINPNEVYQHYKGNLYYILGYACHTETGEDLIAYKSINIEDKRIWVRPVRMWFEEVGSGVQRFTLVPS